MEESLMTAPETQTDGAASTSQATAIATATGVAGVAQTATGQSAAPESAAAGEPQADQGGAGEAGKASAGAPEKYEFSAREGEQFDAGIVTAFSEVARELDLSQESAQKVLDKMGTAIVQRQTDQLAAVRAAWTDESRSDKEFGGDKLNENLGTAKKALDAFGSPALLGLLNDSGLGNHPEVIRFFYRAGKAISEDTFAGGGSNVAGARPGPADFSGQAAALYANQNK